MTMPTPTDAAESGLPDHMAGIKILHALGKQSNMRDMLEVIGQQHAALTAARADVEHQRALTDAAADIAMNLLNERDAARADVLLLALSAEDVVDAYTMVPGLASGTVETHIEQLGYVLEGMHDRLFALANATPPTAADADGGTT